jgi:HEAT repeat protein
MKPLLPVVAALLLCSCGTPEVARDYRAKTYLPAELEAALRSDNPTRRAEAEDQIASLPVDRRIEILLALSRDPEPPMRLLAAKLLGKDSGDPRAAKRLGEMVGLDADPDVRMLAMDGLAAGGSDGALSALLTALEADPSLLVRRHAASALDRLTGQEIGASFVDSLDEAEMSADEAAMAYSDWFESHGKGLRWDAGSSQYVSTGGEAGQ